MNEQESRQKLLQEALTKAQSEFTRRLEALKQCSLKLQTVYKERREIESLKRGLGIEISLNNKQKEALDLEIKKLQTECKQLEQSVEAAKSRIQELNDYDDEQ